MQQETISIFMRPDYDCSEEPFKAVAVEFQTLLEVLASIKHKEVLHVLIALPSFASTFIR